MLEVLMKRRITSILSLVVVHQTECRYHHLAFKKAHSYDVHGGNESCLVLEKRICTETVRKQMIESSFLHICQY